MVGLNIEVVFAFKRNNTIPQLLKGVPTVFGDESVVQDVGGRVARLIGTRSLVWKNVDQINESIGFCHMRKSHIGMLRCVQRPLIVGNLGTVVV